MSWSAILDWARRTDNKTKKKILDGCVKCGCATTEDEVYCKECDER